MSGINIEHFHLKGIIKKMKNLFLFAINGEIFIFIKNKIRVAKFYVIK